VEKRGTVRQATDNNVIWRMRFANCMKEAANTQSEYVNAYCFSNAKHG
jgi:hypothetical protein